MLEKNGGRGCRQSARRGNFQHRLSPAQEAVLAAVVVWGLVWKAVSFWHAARDGRKGWYTALGLVNSAGILDAIYIFGISSWGRRRKEGNGQIPPDEG